MLFLGEQAFAGRAEILAPLTKNACEGGYLFALLNRDSYFSHVINPATMTSRHRSQHLSIQTNRHPISDTQST